MEYLLNLFDVPDVSMRKLGRFFVVFGQHLKDHFIPHARNNYHPHILGDRALALFSGALVCVKILGIALLSWGPVVPAFSSAITEDNIIALTNESRTQYSLSSLAENSLLDKAAQTKANDMLAKGYFSHNTPSGQTPWDFINNAGYNYLMAGENLAINFSQAEDVETAWMNSPGHKANILNKNFEEIGIGISEGQYQGHTAIFVVQMFGTPSAQKVALNDAPTPVQTTAVPVPSAKAADTQSAAQPKASAQKNLKQPDIQPVVVPPLAVSDAQTQMQNGLVQIQAQVAGAPVKVLAYFGQRAIMLSPQPDGSWSGGVALSDLASGSQGVSVKAFDIRGTTAEMQLADFTNSTLDNFQVLGTSTQSSVQVSWMGRIFDPKSAESEIYLMFIAGILASLIMAIAIKRHVQHVNLIANASLVAIFACVLWMAG